MLLDITARSTDNERESPLSVPVGVVPLLLWDGVKAPRSAEWVRVLDRLKRFFKVPKKFRFLLRPLSSKSAAVVFSGVLEAPPLRGKLLLW